MKNPLPIRQMPLVAVSRCLAVVCLLAQCLAGVSQAQVLGVSPETATPVYASKGATPLVMLTMARDHTLFFPAYNDLSDLDGDGALDIRFKPTFEYVGLYNPAYCYSYSNGLFSPLQEAVSGTDATTGKPLIGLCSTELTGNSLWSGNFLNYVTTSRMDALRVALYGGTREVDTVNSTVLRRAYIPQDGHAWAKEYSSPAVDGYEISQYTPLANPSASDRRHFFGSLTSTAAVDATKAYTYTGEDYPPVGVACADLDTCSNYPPLLRVVANAENRVWDWASSERPVLSAVARPKSWSAAVTPKGYVSGTLTDYTVRVQVCVAGFLSGCKQYPNGKYKPTGVLHEYGEDGSVNFGLLTGSYDQNLSGGRLRKNIGKFTDEIYSSTGIFKKVYPSIIQQIDNIRIRNFNYYEGNYKEPRYYDDNFLYRNGKIDLSSSTIAGGSYGSWDNATGTYHVMEEGEYADWGNPIAEMMYEGLRYFAGVEKTDAFNNGYTTEDQAVGLASVDWVDPYSTTNWCAKPSQLVISSVNPSFDSDQLPGNAFSGSVGNTLTASGGASLDVATLTNTIGDTEGINGTSRFIGEVTGKTDGAPTLKAVVALGSVRGLPPDDTNKKGSYYAAAVANFGKSNSLRNIGANPIPSVDTFAVLMNSPIPQIVIPFADDKKISIVPFARTIDAKTNLESAFQPTNQIVGMYIQTLEDPTNATGNYHINFIINYEDRSWGGDFDMDAIAEYDIRATTTGVTVTVKPTYGASGSTQNLGYVISGSNHDGAYLVVQPKNQKANTNEGYYYLNVPPYQWAGYCFVNIFTKSGCMNLPDLAGNGVSTKYFSAASSASDNYLKDPLWYAAKWGGYVDGAPPTGPTTTDPTSYAQVTSPAKLSAAFSNAFQSILDRSSTVGAVGSSSSQLLTDTKLFQASFNQKYFVGDLTATQFGVTTGSGNVADVASYASAWPNGSAATQLATKLAADRKIFYKDPGTTSLLPFLTATTKLTIDTNISFDSNLVNYLRGDPSEEKRNGGSFRNRGLSATSNGVVSFVPNVLGGIINSAPVYFDNTKTVYVGANDGMLHGFNSETGEERFAYMPSAIIPHLSKLSEPAFTHRYYVDGNIAVVGGTKTGGTNYLVGFMGRGAKGLYGLRVNNTGVVTESGAWENFGETDGDMGYLLGKPVTGFLNDGTPVVVFGNGYNSTNNKAVLYVVRVSDGTVLKKFTAPNPNKSSNGLSTPGVVLKAGKLQYAYAGDYLGSVWRFDLTDITGGSASTSSGVGTQKWEGNPNKPIVAPITVSDSGTDTTDTDVQNKRFLFFGTGSDLTSTAASNTLQQTLYGLIDNSDNPIDPLGLKQRYFKATTGTYTGFQGTLAVNVRSFTPPSANDMNGTLGWYLDWTKPANSASEKVFTAATVRSASTPTLVVSSNIMNNNTCTGTGAGFLNALDAYRGGGLTTSFFDINRNRNFGDEKLNGVAIGSIDFGIGNIGQASFPGNNVVVQGDKARSGEQANGGTPGSGNGDSGTQGSTKSSRRISWREIVK